MGFFLVESQLSHYYELKFTENITNITNCKVMRNSIMLTQGITQQNIAHVTMLYIYIERERKREREKKKERRGLKNQDISLKAPLWDYRYQIVSIHHSCQHIVEIFHRWFKTMLTLHREYLLLEEQNWYYGDHHGKISRMCWQKWWRCGDSYHKSILIFWNHTGIYIDIFVWSVCILKSQRILYISFSGADSGLCICQQSLILISCSIPSLYTFYYLLHLIFSMDVF